MTDPNSGKVRNEGRQHPAYYVVMDLGQLVGNRHASELLWSSLSETYAEGGCELHVHFRAGIVYGGTSFIRPVRAASSSLQKR
jgi:hypothetical protein